MGPIPGTLIQTLLAVSFVLASPMMARVARGDLIVECLQLTDNRARVASRTQSGMELSPSKIAAANA